MSVNDPAIVMEAIDLSRYYSRPHTAGISGLFGAKPLIKALDGVSFQLRAGTTLGLVGESGSGKSTLARLATLLDRPTSGRLLIDGAPTTKLPPAALKNLRRTVQMVFQNPFSALNPRQTIGACLAEPLRINTNLGRNSRRDAVAAMITKVGLSHHHLNRYPHMFSGGQRQRIAIARALMLRPRILVADEPVSALDVSVQAQILNLLKELQVEYGVAYLFISHDLDIVRHLADDIMVMAGGKIIESGPTEAIFASPSQAYTKQLLASRPTVNRPAS